MAYASFEAFATMFQVEVFWVVTLCMDLWNVGILPQDSRRHNPEDLDLMYSIFGLQFRQLRSWRCRRL